MVVESSSSLSDRALENVSNNVHWRAIRKALASPFDKDKHPEGKINLGLAESSLMHKELKNRLESHFTIDPASHFTYGHGPNGSPALLKAATGFLNSRFDPFEPVHEEELIITSGVTASTDALTYCICNDGEGILIAKPLYAGFLTDIEMRSRGRLLPVSFLRDGHEYSVDDLFDAEANRNAYEKAIEEYTEKGIKVRAVILSNPQNPLGRCYPPETLREIARFCMRHDLHLISDEIYANSTFRNPAFPDAQQFKSILSIDMSDIIDPNRVHVMYGMSKDFCANGMRLGILQTRDANLHEAVSSINVFGWPAYATQDMWAQILMDSQFVDKFININQKRLEKSYSKFAAFLDEHNIPYIKGGNAGFFFWVQLIQANKGDIVETETSIRTRKQQLVQACYENGLYIRDGSDYYSEEREDGWFRITFTVDNDILEAAIERLLKSLRELKLLNPAV